MTLFKCQVYYIAFNGVENNAIINKAINTQVLDFGIILNIDIPRQTAMANNHNTRLKWLIVLAPRNNASNIFKRIELILKFKYYTLEPLKYL